MDRRLVETALREGVPFEIETAGGSRVRVTDARNTVLGKTHFVVIDEDDLPHVVPLLTMSAIHYLPQSA